MQTPTMNYGEANTNRELVSLFECLVTKDIEVPNDGNMIPQRLPCVIVAKYD